MVVPFGVGVGDFFAVSKLAKEVVSELKENGEAPRKYQNIIIELESLGRALSQVYEVKPAKDGVALLDATRAAATACKRPLEDFLEKVSKFDKSLGTWDAKEKRFKGIGRRIQFSLALDKEVTELRAALAGHVSTINMLLLIQTLAFDTTQQREWTETSKSLDEQYQSLSKLLGEVSESQNGTSAQLSACKDDLNEMMGSMQISSTQNADTQLKLDKQKATLDGVRSDIHQLKDKLEREQAKAHTRKRVGQKALDMTISTLAITSKIFTLVVSGTIVVSINDIATEAADLSRLSGKPVKIGKRPSSDLIRAGFGGAHNDVGLDGNRAMEYTYNDMGLDGNKTMDIPTASEQKIHFVSHSPKRERHSQDVTVSAAEGLGLFEKVWNSPDRLSKERHSASIDSPGYQSIGLSCLLRQIPPADLQFLVEFEPQDQCDRAHYFQWRNHRLKRIESLGYTDMSPYKFQTAVVAISHFDDFDRLRSRISPPQTESAVELFRDWVILRLGRKGRTLHYVITVATDLSHIVNTKPGLRISHADYDNTPRHESQIVSDVEESVVSGLVEDIPSLLATTLVSLSPCFSVPEYSILYAYPCSSVLRLRNWRAYHEYLGGDIPDRAIVMTIYANPLAGTTSTGGLLEKALSYGHYGTFFQSTAQETKAESD